MLNAEQFLKIMSWILKNRKIKCSIFSASTHLHKLISVLSIANINSFIRLWTEPWTKIYDSDWSMTNQQPIRSRLLLLFYVSQFHDPSYIGNSVGGYSKELCVLFFTRNFFNFNSTFSILSLEDKGTVGKSCCIDEHSAIAEWGWE